MVKNFPSCQRSSYITSIIKLWGYVYNIAQNEGSYFLIKNRDLTLGRSQSWSWNITMQLNRIKINRRTWIENRDNSRITRIWCLNSAPQSDFETVASVLDWNETCFWVCIYFKCRSETPYFIYFSINIFVKQFLK